LLHSPTGTRKCTGRDVEPVVTLGKCTGARWLVAFSKLNSMTLPQGALPWARGLYGLTGHTTRTLSTISGNALASKFGENCTAAMPLSELDAVLPMAPRLTRVTSNCRTRDDEHTPTGASIKNHLQNTDRGFALWVLPLTTTSRAHAAATCVVASVLKLSTRANYNAIDVNVQSWRAGSPCPSWSSTLRAHLAAVCQPWSHTKKPRRPAPTRWFRLQQGTAALSLTLPRRQSARHC
jgi:hypothetical protein